MSNLPNLSPESDNWLTVKFNYLFKTALEPINYEKIEKLWITCNGGLDSGKDEPFCKVMFPLI